jgi:hypothetical protein
MALGQLFVFADRAKVERGVFEDRLDLGSGLIDHSQNMTAAAMQIAEK